MHAYIDAMHSYTCTYIYMYTYTCLHFSLSVVEAEEILLGNNLAVGRRVNVPVFEQVVTHVPGVHMHENSVSIGPSVPVNQVN